MNSVIHAAHSFFLSKVHNAMVGSAFDHSLDMHPQGKIACPPSSK